MRLSFFYKFTTLLLISAFFVAISTSDEKHSKFHYELQTYFAINGNIMLSDEQIFTAIETFALKPLIAIDLHKVATSLNELPQIARVNLRKRYPNTLAIDIEEKIPVATFYNEGKTYLIDKNGTILQETLKPLGIAIMGEKSATHFADFYKKLCGQNNKSKFAQSIKKAILINGRRWDILSKEDLLIKLPEKIFADAEERIPQIITDSRRYFTGDKKISVVDLRIYPYKVFLKYSKIRRKKYGKK